jgi:hypothetical protein
MKKLYKAFHLLVMFPFVIAACRLSTVPAPTEEQSAEKDMSYAVVLGKSMIDNAVIEFIVDNNCVPANQFRLCKDVGMALWINSDQVVETIYFYAGGIEGFKRYRGELPFGVTFYDPMWRVQEKLRNLSTDDSSYDAGLPDETSSPDRTHYWAIYRRLGLTIIYDSPSADQDAYIYAILMNK